MWCTVVTTQHIIIVNLNMAETDSGINSNVIDHG